MTKFLKQKNYKRKERQRGESRDKSTNSTVQYLFEFQFKHTEKICMNNTIRVNAGFLMLLKNQC